MTETTAMAETAEATRAYKVPAGNLERLQDEIAKLNKRAAKLGVVPVALVVGPMYEEQYTEVHQGDCALRDGAADCLCRPVQKVRRWHDCTLAGETPKLAGWSFVGAIQHVVLEDGTMTAVLRAAPNVQIPAEYRGASNRCDHCRMDRRRNDTFVVRHEGGQFKQVGRNCLVDFLGGKDPHAVAAGLELLLSALELCGMSEDEGFGGGGGSRGLIHIADWLAVTAAAIRVDGWTSRKKAEEAQRCPTVSTVNSYFWARSGDSKYDRELRLKYAPADEDRELAGKTLVWVREVLASKPELSDYEYNLVVACKMQGVDRTGGLVASAIACYKREVEREVLRNLRAQEWSKIVASSRHLGAEGKRGYFELVLTGTSEMEGDYGVTTLHRFLTPDGSLAVWFASGGRAIAQEGEKVLVKATVKRHVEYKGAKQTILSRVDRVDEWFCYKCNGMTKLVQPCEHHVKTAAKFVKECAKLGICWEEAG